jgi:hypothetical protein
MEGTPIAARTRRAAAAAAAPPPTASGAVAAPSSKRGAPKGGGGGGAKRARRGAPAATRGAAYEPPAATPRMAFFTSAAQEAGVARMEAARFAPVQAAYDRRVAAAKRENPSYCPKYTARAGFAPLPLRFDVGAASGAATLVADGDGGAAFGLCPAGRQAGGGVYRIDLDFTPQVGAFQAAAARGYAISFRRGRAVVYAAASTDQMASLTDAATGETLEAWEEDKLDIAFL